MYPNEVQLLSVFARATGEPLQSAMVSSESGFDIVVQARSGMALFGTGAQYKVFVIVRNLTGCQGISYAACLGPGHLGDARWPTPAVSCTLEVPPRPFDDQPHVCEVISILEIGVAHPHISFLISPKFVLI